MYPPLIVWIYCIICPWSHFSSCTLL